MFIQEKEGSSGKFITVSGGRIKLRVEEGTSGAKSRINLKGETVWEMSYKGITIFPVAVLVPYISPDLFQSSNVMLSISIVPLLVVGGVAVS